MPDVSDDIKAFLDYVDCGIIKGKFVKELDATVNAIKSNEKARLDFMTFQMYLLEHKLEAQERRRNIGIESVALNMLRRGKSPEEIHQDTQLSLERIQELVKSSIDSSTGILQSSAN